MGNHIKNVIILLGGICARSVLFRLFVVVILFTILFNSTNRDEYGDSDIIVKYHSYIEYESDNMTLDTNSWVSAALLNSQTKTIRNIEARMKSHGVKTKYILVWTPFVNDLFDYESLKGKSKFEKCPINNCYITDKRTYFGENVEHFDAIIFHGKSYTFWNDANLLDMPRRRTPNQVYIFYETRSAYEYTVCVDALNNVFNWTMTYKLNSDIPCPYINIKNRTGHVFGPKIGIHWLRDTFDRGIDYMNADSKTKAIVWFEKYCTRKSETKKIEIINSLKSSLGKYGLDVDVVGTCRSKNCKGLECEEIQKELYYFYLPFDALDNEFFINEDLLVALQYGLVPVVTGDISLESFLPPDAYIDGNNKTAEELAATLVDVMINHRLYRSYFRWKKHYKLEKADINETFCSLCAALHNDTKLKRRQVYVDFLTWWNPEYKTRCKERVH